MQKRLPWFPEHNRVLISLLIFSVLARLAAALYLGDAVEILPGTYDQVSYHNLALRVLDGHGFTFGEPWWPLTAANAPTAHWSYLYTLYLVIVYALFGPHPLVARLIQALIVGLLQPLLAYLLAGRVFGQLAALTAAALTTVYAYFIYYTATLMTESFYITAILGALYLAILVVDRAVEPDLPNSRSTTLVLAILLGVTLGIAVLLRQLILLFVPFLFLWIWWTVRQRGGRWAIPALLLSGFMILGMILPFTVDNYTRFGRFVLLNTNAGYAFFWANHPVYGTHFVPAREMQDYQELIPSELHNLDEAALDQELLKRGLRFVLDDPVRYVLLSISRTPEYFRFWPSSDSSLVSNVSRVSSFGLFLPFMLYGLLLALFTQGHNQDRHDRLSEASSPTLQPSNLPPSNPTPDPLSPAPLLPCSPASTITSPAFLLILFSGVYTAIHLLSWALVRYRLPVDAVLLIFAGLGIVHLIEKFRPGLSEVIL